MFTGIVETVGSISRLAARGDAMRLAISAGGLDLSDVRLGDSIAVSGPCLTVVALAQDGFEVDVSGETLARTTLGSRRAGDRVNLEKALRASDRLGGHLVTGHIDGIGTLAQRAPRGDYLRLVFSIPLELARYVAFKGSICIDGVSLTVNAAGDDCFEVLTIPHTLSRTTLGELREGEAANIEVDLLARYLERLLSRSALAAPGAGVTLEALAQAGFADGREPG